MPSCQSNHQLLHNIMRYYGLTIIKKTVQKQYSMFKREIRHSDYCLIQTQDTVEAIKIDRIFHYTTALKEHITLHLNKKSIKPLTDHAPHNGHNTQNPLLSNSPPLLHHQHLSWISLTAAHPPQTCWLWRCCECGDVR